VDALLEVGGRNKQVEGKVSSELTGTSKRKNKPGKRKAKK